MLWLVWINKFSFMLQKILQNKFRLFFSLFFSDYLQFVIFKKEFILRSAIALFKAEDSVAAIQVLIPSNYFFLV
jgi:hypothetical protein